MGKKKVDWIIHLCANGPCECGCGRIETGFLPDMCNAHTHGMEKYDHPDFQTVLRASNEEITYVLNTFGLRVQAGEKFHAGQFVSGIFLDCDVRLDEYEETGRKVLRVIIPDRNNVFPEDPACEKPYSMQLLLTDELHRPKRLRISKKRR